MTDITKKMKKNGELPVRVPHATDLRNYVLILFKRKKIILSVFFGACLIGLAVSLFMPPVFQATSKIMVEKESDSEKALLFRMNLPNYFDNYDWIQTELEIINSYPVAERIVRDLDLYLEDDDVAGLKDKDIMIRQRVKKLQAALSVSNSRKSNVVEISCESESPTLAKIIANRVVATYKEYRTELYDESETYKFFENQMKIASEKLRELEERQSSFKHDENLISPESQADIILSKLAEYEKSLTAVQAKRMGKEARLAVIKEQTNLSQLTIPSTEFSENPNREKYIAKLKSDLLEKEIQLEKLLQNFKPEYEGVVELERDIAAIKDKIQSEIHEIIEQEETAIQASKAEEQILKESIAQLKQEIKDLAQKEYEYTQLSRGIADNREIYSMLLKQREEARISLAKLERGVTVRVIDPASAPTDPIRPRKKLYCIIAIFLGMVGGLGAALLVEYFDHSINNIEQLENMTGLKILGSVRELNN